MLETTETVLDVLESIRLDEETLLKSVKSEKLGFGVRVPGSPPNDSHVRGYSAGDCKRSFTSLAHYEPEGSIPFSDSNF